MLTGAVRWNTKAMGLSLHEKHIDMLKRLASSGYTWAREALAPGAVLLYVAAGGFVPHFLERAEIEGIRVIAWSLDDIYSDPGEIKTN
jgi:hypothetical protein